MACFYSKWTGGKMVDCAVHFFFATAASLWHVWCVMHGAVSFCTLWVGRLGWTGGGVVQ